MYSNTDNKVIQIYKGKQFYTSGFKKVPIVIVFDMDETLGTFTDLERLWSIINTSTLTVSFNELLDLYPEFLRCGIIPILEFLYMKKKKGICDKIYIYTNNQCSPEWCKMIAKYFDYKLKTESALFDQLICAFKINDKIIELARTTHHKTYNDFIRCTLLLPKQTKICFIDNSYFYEMKHDCIYYIQPLTYLHHLSPDNIIERFYDVYLKGTNNYANLYHQLYNNLMKNHVFNDTFLSKKIEIDILVAQKMMYHIKEFFYLTQKRNRTKKFKYPTARYTRKKITINNRMPS